MSSRAVLQPRSSLLLLIETLNVATALPSSSTLVALLHSRFDQIIAHFFQYAQLTETEEVATSLPDCKRGAHVRAVRPETQAIADDR